MRLLGCQPELEIFAFVVGNSLEPLPCRLNGLAFPALVDSASLGLFLLGKRGIGAAAMADALGVGSGTGIGPLRGLIGRLLAIGALRDLAAAGSIRLRLLFLPAGYAASRGSL